MVRVIRSRAMRARSLGYSLALGVVLALSACSSDKRETGEGSATRPEGVTQAEPGTAAPTPSVAARQNPPGPTPRRPPPPLSSALGADRPSLPGNQLPVRMKCLIEAYPDFLCGGTSTHVRWCNGKETLWDDGRAKSDHATLLDTADLQDQMAQPYPLGANYPIPLPVNYEPGRVRHTDFFLEMYGDSESAVRKTLTRIRWLPKTANRSIRVTTVNGVHEKLAAVSKEIEKLPRKLQLAVAKSSGPFYWRNIKGTQRKSMHSFAIAFDVGLDRAHYWRWARKDSRGLYRYKNEIPLEVVEIFERHGFIWGGKWYHLDTPHFEYRPELLHPDCLAPAAPIDSPGSPTTEPSPAPAGSPPSKPARSKRRQGQ